MKIIYCTNSTIPSSQANSIHVMKMCQALANNGHSVELLIPRLTRDEVANVTSEVFRNYAVSPAFTVKKFNVSFLKGSLYWFGIFAGIYCRVHRPCLVYGRSLVACWSAAKLGLRVRFELHFLNEGATSIQDKIQGFLLRSLIRSRSLDKLITISESLKNDLVTRYSIDPNRVLVAHDGADVCANVTDYTLHVPPRVGYIGNLYPGKGMELIADLSMILSEFEFFVVGGTSDHIHYWKGKSGLNVNFVGSKSPREAEELRFQCDILIAPYQRKVEGAGGGNIARWMSPLKIFEYMASGKPIVCSDLPVLREVLVQNYSALLCPPEQPHVWAKEIRRLIESGELRQKLGQNARQVFEQKYTWNGRANEVIR